MFAGAERKQVAVARSSLWGIAVPYGEVAIVVLNLMCRLRSKRLRNLLQIMCPGMLEDAWATH